MEGCMKTSWEKQAPKLQQIHTHTKKKKQPNTTLKIVIKNIRAQEKKKKKSTKQIQNN